MKRMLLVIAVLVAAGALWAQIADNKTLGEQTDTASTDAGAPPIRRVEVVNFPDPQNVTGEVQVSSVGGTVEIEGQVAVTNLPPTGTQRFELVGFTAATYPATIGAFGFTQACQLEFPGSRLCSLEEAIMTVEPPDLSLSGTSEAWIWTGRVDPSNGNFRACYGWTSGSAHDYGYALDREGRWPRIRCNNIRSVSCCAPSGA